MPSSPTTGSRYKRGDTVKLSQGLRGRVAELLPVDANGTRSYRVRIECPSPKPIHLDVAESLLELITRHAAKRAVTATARATPRAFQNEEITGADFEHILAVAKLEKSGRGLLRRKTSSVPSVE